MSCWANDWSSAAAALRSAAAVSRALPSLSEEASVPGVDGSGDDQGEKGEFDFLDIPFERRD